jgi:hypothetical protein
MTQTTPPQGDTPSGAPPIGLTCTIEGLLLAGLLVLLHETLQPNFKGGGYVLCCVLLAIVFLGFMFARDLWTAWSSRAGRGGTAAVSANWNVIARSLASVIVLFGAMLVLGMVVAMPLVAFTILRWHMGLGVARAAGVALLLGVAMPVAFSLAVGMPLWNGLIPEIVPGWIGGAIIPSL